MNGPNRSDPLDELRRANPVDADRLPSASLARVRARVKEDLMSDIETHASRPQKRPARPLAVALAGAAIAIGALAVFAGGRVAPGPDPSTGPGVAACVESYSLETLRNRTYAFDGTVAAISGDSVTFRVNEAYRGASSGEITLTATGMSGASITSAGGPTLNVGERYLVAGDGTFVWSCGFTQAYDPAIAASWASTLGS